MKTTIDLYNKDMKKFIPKQIYKKRIGDGQHCSVYVKDIPENLLSTDEIDIVRDEGFISENESWDAQTVLVITRLVEETNEEYASRKWREERDKKWSKQRRYENYLKLKEEFENED